MATTFLEPGGDATFNAALTTAGGFWLSTVTPTPTVVSDIVNGTHLRSLRVAPSGGSLTTPGSVMAGSGGRWSVYIYINILPGATASIINIQNSGSANVSRIRITNAGVIQLWEASAQIGSNGPTLSVGTWYRISYASTVTSTVVNRFEVFVSGVSAISVTNATITSTAPDRFAWGNNSTDATLDMRFSDFYIDNSTSLIDPGNIWVTAKRPNANGTANNFSTQIGAGGSGYGTGHSPQVNERTLSTTNGWSMIGAGSAVTEEYNVENNSTGDIYVNPATVIDFIGWAYTSALVGETVQVVLNGVNNAKAITSTNTMYTVAAATAGYPAGTGTDIGIITDTSLTTVSLFECGIMVAFIPDTNTIQNYAPYIHVRDGMSRNERAT